MIKKIPSDTLCYHYYNINPKNRRTTDCVVRALATTLNQSWQQTYKELFDLGIPEGLPPEDDLVVVKYLKSKNCLRVNQPKKKDGSKGSQGPAGEKGAAGPAGAAGAAGAKGDAGASVTAINLVKDVSGAITGGTATLSDGTSVAITVTTAEA